MKYLLILFSSFLFAQENELKYTINNFDHSDYLVVLFPGFGYTHQQTDEKTSLNEYLFSNNISTLIINFYSDLFLEEEDFEIIRDLISKYGKYKKILIGGFSIGGNIAMNFHEFEKKKKNPLNIKGIFLIDSPIDLQFLFNVCKNRKDDLDFDRSEHEFLYKTLNYYQTDIDDFFNKNSPYLHQKNESKYYDVNFLIFSKPDTEWHKQKGYKLEEINFYVLNNFFENNLKHDSKNIFYTNYTFDNTNPHDISIINNEVFLDFVLKL